MIENPSSSVPRRAYLTLGLLTFTYVFAYADRYLMAILVQPIKADLKLSDSALGTLTGIAFFVFYAAAGIPLGRLADRISRRVLLASSLAAWSVATAACGAAGSFLQLMLARMSVGVGEGGCAPASHSLISDLFPAGRRALPLAIFTCGGTLGMFGGFAAGGALEARFGWRGAFWVLGGLGMTMVPIIALFLRDPRGRATTIRPAPVPLKTLFAIPGLLTLVLSYSFMTAGMLGVTQWLPAFYERSFGMNRLAIGSTLATVGGIGGIAGLLIGGWLADRGSRRNAAWPLYQFVGAATLAVPLQLAMLLVPNVQVSFALAFLSMLAAWAANGPAFAVIQTISPPGARATATGTILVGSALIGMGGGPFAAGLLSDAFAPVRHADSLRWALVTVVVAGGVLAMALGIRAIRRVNLPGKSAGI